MTISPEQEPLHVVIAGAGVAGLETVMALRDAAGVGVRITLLSPQEHFDYLPLSVGDPFALGRARLIPLDQVARDFNIERCVDSLASVNPSAHTLSLTSGAELHYDKLIVATGAKREAAYEHATTFRGQDDVEALHGLVQDVEGGYVKRIAFVVPPGVAWSLPLYELALMTAQRAFESQMEVELTLVTPEERALGVFGSAASDDVERLLHSAGVLVHRATTAEIPHKGTILLHPSGETITCDRVVALPVTRGIPIAGLPADGDGFLPIDPFAHVGRCDDVYAAGDGTNFPLKQGGIACQQADIAAEDIARAAGADVEARTFRPVLRGQLLTGAKPHFMRRDVRAVTSGKADSTEHILWWPPTKIAGKFLGPYIALQEDRESAGSPAEAIRSRVLRSPVLLTSEADGDFELELGAYALAAS
ncbi:MAG: sulfide:quinone oxidoreductase [Thermoleophilaceae bacterium]|jgi:sulfide:quinone oxidoreductase|nr:sulfide:quinone oxidoreductase [Thermoleophilaceae bacterium]